MENVKRYFWCGMLLILLRIIVDRSAGVLWDWWGAVLESRVAVEWESSAAENNALRSEQYRKKLPPGQTKASVTFSDGHFSKS
jgi:hypothetical protein